MEAYMPYVRTRGSQVLIVHGERDKESKTVNQKIIFTFYSQKEVEQAFGADGKQHSWSIVHIVENEYPQIKFDWKNIKKEVYQNLNILPLEYHGSENPNQKRFRNALSNFIKELALLDPQYSTEAKEIISSHRHELEHLSEIVDWRIKMAEMTDKPFDFSDSGRLKFHWLSDFNRRQLPPEIEEQLADLYQKGDYNKASSIFKLYVESFEDYAEGFNYLGLIALENNKLEEAEAYFKQTMTVGRRLFPKRISKNHYWNNIDTRPYMRGLRNLILTSNRSGKFKQALTLCEQLEIECNDRITAEVHRASIYLNLGEFEKAFDYSSKLVRLFPSESFIAAFAKFELGAIAESNKYFIHGIFNAPLTGRMLVGQKVKVNSKSYGSVDDYNGGFETLQTLGHYLSNKHSKMKKNFMAILDNPKVKQFEDELRDCEEKRASDRQGNNRNYFMRINEMKTLEFAEKISHRLNSPLFLVPPEI